MNTIFVGKGQPKISYWKEHFHNCWEIVIPIEGAGRVEARSEVFNFYPGSIYIIPPEAMHLTTSDTYFTDIYIHASQLPFPTQRITALYGIKALPHIAELIHSLYLTKSDKGTINTAVDFIVKLCLDMLSEAHYDSLANKIRLFLSQNVADQSLSMKTLSSHFQYDIDYLRKAFKKEYGKTPMEYLDHLRIAKAQELFIKMPIYNVTQVAQLCGFNDPLYFSRFFKKHTGASPKEYRSSLSN